MKTQVKYVATLGVVALVSLSALTLTATANRGNGDLGTVYVTSQDLYYDTFVPVNVLPNRGRFQKLEDGATEFGPGDPGYLGGRWWVDSNGNDVRDDEDTFLLCPLLPPGRPTP